MHKNIVIQAVNLYEFGSILIVVALIAQSVEKGNPSYTINLHYNCSTPSLGHTKVFNEWVGLCTAQKQFRFNLKKTYHGTYYTHLPSMPS